MSAELMKSKIVRHRPSVSQVISEPNARISPGPYVEVFFFKYEFLQIFFFFVNMRPYGSENVKTLLLLQSRSRKFWNLSWIFLSIVLTKPRLGFL